MYSLAIPALDDFVERVFTERASVAMLGPADNALVAKRMCALKQPCDLDSLAGIAYAASRNVVLDTLNSLMLFGAFFILGIFLGYFFTLKTSDQILS